MEGKQDAILFQMRLKFGDVSEDVVKRLKGIMDDDVLDTLLGRILDAKSLEDMGLSDDTSL
jgi:hypothetical protein